MSQVSANTANDDYEIGRNRPPKDTRFKPGRSGNPKGRPKGSTNAKSAAARVISEKVTVKDGKKTRRVTKFEALLQAQLVNAIKGDSRAANAVIGILAKVGVLGEQEEATRKVLSMNDAAILDDYIRRRTGPSAVDSDQRPDTAKPGLPGSAAGNEPPPAPSPETNSSTKQQA